MSTGYQQFEIEPCKKCGLSGRGFGTNLRLANVRMRHHEENCSGDSRYEYLRRLAERVRQVKARATHGKKREKQD